MRRDAVHSIRQLRQHDKAAWLTAEDNQIVVGVHVREHELDSTRKLWTEHLFSLGNGLADAELIARLEEACCRQRKPDLI